MTDTKNTEVPPASEPPAPAQEAPVVVRERRSWFRPLISALVVVAALVVGGIGGFAIATATHAGRGAVVQGELPAGPGSDQQGQVQPGPGQPGQQMPRDPQGGSGANGRNGERPQPPSDQSDDDSGDSGTDPSDG